MSDYQARRLGQLGSKGEYTAHFLAINQDKEVLQLANPFFCKTTGNSYYWLYWSPSSYSKISDVIFNYWARKSCSLSRAL
jgi:hypothetical protein